jgi:hypothetical protein
VEKLITLLIVIGAGVFCWRQIAKFFDERKKEASLALVLERANYFLILRRELANMLIWRNPHRYVELYRAIHDEVSSYASLKFEIIDQRLTDLTLKYPTSADFDAVGTREYVLHDWVKGLSYAKGDELTHEAEIEDHYKNIIRFEGLSTISNGSWKEAHRLHNVHLTDDEELAHLTDYAQVVCNTQFKVRLARAFTYAEARGSSAGGGIDDFDEHSYSVRRLPSFADQRYGICVKKTNEYGIYSFFVFDDGRTRHAFYRSDAEFETEEPLKVIDGKFDELTDYRYEFQWPK